MSTHLQWWFCRLGGRYMLRVLVGWMALATVQAQDAAERVSDPPSVSGRFIALGDLHFDPFSGLTKAGFAELMGAPLSEWPSRLEHQPSPAYGSDSPWSLIRGCLDDARARLPDPDWVFIAGDVLAHEWADHYDRIAPRSRVDDPAAFDAFTSRVVQFLADQLHERFPKAPILPVPGNDDSECGDYQVTPRGRFLAACAETWTPLAIRSADGDRRRIVFRKTAARGGYYTASLPHLPRHRLIALNTVFFAPQYSNACGDPTETPAREEFRWLESMLTAAERADETVWLLMHLPPGIDSFETWRAKGAVQPLWQPEMSAWFLKLVQRHSKRIQIAFAGHTHMDDFRLVQLGGRPVLLTKIIPGISPIYGNNPGYHLVTYERVSGRILDYESCRYTLNVGDIPQWISGYTFSRSYPGYRVNAESMMDFGTEVRRGGDLASTFLRNYAGAAPQTPISVEALGCAILNVIPSGYASCAAAVDGQK